MKQVQKAAGDDRRKKRDYHYSELGKLKIGSEPVNVYGVILDATFPHKSHKSDKYICTFKIADPTRKLVNGVVEHVSVVFFAKKFEDLPVSQTVGEIIRIHRATVGSYKGDIQLTVNICFNSSWALFAPSTQGDKKSVSDMGPISFFGQALHMEAADLKMVQSLRKWTMQVF